ncbi:MAG: hypothetical protein IIZ08_05850 [Clostridia bacterium]|nr:hypothetical protein [Clostridia bacterium]
MKKFVRKSACFLAAFSMLLVLLCSCGSELDGTWRSCEDEDTRIKISGEKVRITYDDFRIDGTYEMDDSGNIIFHLTDKNGNKYKIEAKYSTDQKNKRLTLTNAKGESEVFER